MVPPRFALLEEPRHISNMGILGETSCRTLNALSSEVKRAGFCRHGKMRYSLWLTMPLYACHVGILREPRNEFARVESCNKQAK